MSRSNNPFDSSSDEEDNVNHRISVYDGDDESCLFEECQEFVANESNAIDTISISNDNMSETSSKRVAPLSFQPETVIAHPALDFNVNLEVDDFVSPLETALINQVDHLKASPSDDENVVNPMDNNENIYHSSYFTLNNLYSITHRILSPISKKLSSNEVVDQSASGNSKISVTSAVSPQPLDNTHQESLERQALLSRDKADHESSYGSVMDNPLKEAKQVLQRMDNISQSITNVMTRSGSSSCSTAVSHTKSLHKDSKTGHNMVLKKIVDHPKDSDLTIDHRHAGTPWTRQLILEELGTASSWVILILPYLAFFIALLMNSSQGLLQTSFTPSNLHASCSVEMDVLTFPLNISSTVGSCYYKTVGHNGEIAWVLSSGPFKIPVSSSFLRGDLIFDTVSPSVLGLIQNGSVLASIVVIQRLPSEYPQSNWQKVSESPPMHLKLLCDNITDSLLPKMKSCSIPGIVDVHFHSMDSNFLNGGDVRVDILFGLKSDHSSRDFRVLMNTNHDDSYGNLDPNIGLKSIAESASIHLFHPTESVANILVTVRLACFIFSITFLAVWLLCMKGNGRFFRFHRFIPSKLARMKSKFEYSNTKQDMNWWENPWISFPERRYLFCLLCCLVVVQNPVLLYMHFYPQSYSNVKIHVLANMTTGIGLHSVLFLWLCVFEGLRYHTADHARKRAEFQKEVLEIRRTSEFLNPKNSSSTYYMDYFEEFGDINGVYGTILRLKHDPFGEYWADFLIPKLAILFVGVCSVCIASLHKFSTASLDLSHGPIYWYASLFQIFILFLWTNLIFQASLRTGDLLRKEPFLSTRPAQLAYRFLMSILMLGTTSIVIPLTFYIFSCVKKMQIGHGQWSGLHDAVVELVVYATETFPFSCSASSLRSGDIIYITTCTLVVAFIFLPSTDYILDQDSNFSNASPKDSSSNIENQRRDKRWILPLSRYTHTWRVFPLPIERHPFNANSKKMKNVDCYQLDHKFQLISETGRGLIYKENYVPLFCVETALWLANCSWQTYYSSTEYKFDDFAPGLMNLDFCGLELENDIYHEETDTRVYVASNLASQVDGEQDSIIVISFRGTASMANVRTDLRYNQVLLPEFLINDDQNQTEFTLEVSNGSNQEHGVEIHLRTNDDIKKSQGLKHGADLVLKSLPISRQVYPRIHAGFLTVYLHVRDELIQACLTVMQRQIMKSLDKTENDGTAFVLPKIYVCGHSLGGCLGQLLALDIATNVEIKLVPAKPYMCHDYDLVRIKSEDKHSISGQRGRKRFNTLPEYLNKSVIEHGSVDFVHGMLSGIGFVGEQPRSLRPPIAVYTFGQPRVGNHAFARLYKHHVPHTFRLVTEGDPFTVIPLATLCPLTFYKHGGLDVILDEGKTGNILVGPTVVETLFRFSKVRTNFQHHLLDTYRDGLESALTMDELQEIYRTHGVDSRNIRGGYNRSDLLPEWVTKFSQKRSY